MKCRSFMLKSLDMVRGYLPKNIVRVQVSWCKLNMMVNLRRVGKRKTRRKTEKELRRCLFFFRLPSRPPSSHPSLRHTVMFNLPKGDYTNFG